MGESGVTAPAGRTIFISSDRNRALAIKKLSDMHLNEYEVKFVKKRDTRTVLQNSALHKYFQLLSEALNDAGYDMKHVVNMKKADIPWTPEMIKENLWRGIQISMELPVSTADQRRTSYSKIYENLNRFTSSKLGVHVPFPSEDSMR